MIEATCTVCRRREARLLHVVDGWRIVRCTSCSHRYLSPRPSPEEVRRRSADPVRAPEHVPDRVGQVVRRIERHEPAGRMLDVGSRLGPRVLHGRLDSIEHTDESFDVVTMFDVIAHLEDPRRDLLEVWRVLRRGGLLVVATPDAGSIATRALGSRWPELKRAPDHLQFFTVRSLSELLAVSGLTAFQWHTIGRGAPLRTMIADLAHAEMCVYARKTGVPQPLATRWRQREVRNARVRRSAVTPA